MLATAEKEAAKVVNARPNPVATKAVKGSQEICTLPCMGIILVCVIGGVLVGVIPLSSKQSVQSNGTTTFPGAGACYPNPCQNDANCIEANETYMCLCDVMYTGIHCQNKTGPCDSEPCLNGGKCTQDNNTYTCSCNVSHSGRNCETQVYMSCMDALNRGENKSEAYLLMVGKLNNYTYMPFWVWCDMETDGGGWTVFQYRSNSDLNFKRNMSEYVRGFGSVRGDHWLGLDKLDRIAYAENPSMKIVVQLNGTEETAFYKSIALLKEDNYRLFVADFEGDLNVLEMAHWGEFSTIDVDNTKLCARKYGAFWYNSFIIDIKANFNGVWDSKQNKYIWWGQPKHHVSSTKLMVRRNEKI